MAGDWIKMRSELFTHPKVIRISSALKADTLRTVGGLMSVWCLFDIHSTDGKLDGYTLDAIDAYLRWEGFAAAMVSVGWLRVEQDYKADNNPQSLVLPDFETHNGQSAKRRAQDAKRKTEVRKVSASQADKKKTREEKRREDNNTYSVEREYQESARERAPDPETKPPWEPPDGINKTAWAEFEQHRKALRKKLTDQARKLAWESLMNLTHDQQQQVINASIANGWTGLFPEKITQEGNRNAGNSKSDEREVIRRKIREDGLRAERELLEEARLRNAAHCGPVSEVPGSIWDPF